MTRRRTWLYSLLLSLLTALSVMAWSRWEWQHRCYDHIHVGQPAADAQRS